MKKAIYVMLAGICLWCVSAVNADASNKDAKKLKGQWAVTVTEAPAEYRNFDITIKEKDSKYLIDVKGGDINLKDQKFTEKDGKLTGNLYVGEYVKVTIWEEKGVVKGKADTSMGPLDLLFKKKAAKQ